MKAEGRDRYSIRLLKIKEALHGPDQAWIWGEKGVLPNDCPRQVRSLQDKAQSAGPNRNRIPWLPTQTNPQQWLDHSLINWWLFFLELRAMTIKLTPVSISRWPTDILDLFLDVCLKFWCLLLIVIRKMSLHEWHFSWRWSFSWLCHPRYVNSVVEMGEWLMQMSSSQTLFPQVHVGSWRVFHNKTAILEMKFYFQFWQQTTETAFPMLYHSILCLWVWLTTPDIFSSEQFCKQDQSLGIVHWWCTECHLTVQFHYAKAYCTPCNASPLCSSHLECSATCWTSDGEFYAQKSRIIETKMFHNHFS